jgi:TRAP-type mannitol/chloroaromatic compound transport system permease small subunit
MQGLLRIASAIDWLNKKFGVIATWTVLISCLVSALNAIIRYVANDSSNAWLELQWYLFAFTVMFGAAHVLNTNEHVRVDIIYGKLSPRTRALIDLGGMILFLMPAVALIFWMSWPWFYDALKTGEMSSNAGGLVRWPAKLAIPLGFLMLALQGISEIIKRVGYLSGRHQMDTQYERPLQ